MQLYTGRGDQGTTDLLGERVGKDDPRIAALGALDEATSAIGLGRAHATSDETKEMLVVAQRDLYQVMAEIAFTDRLRPAAYTLGEDRVLWLEAATDAITARIELAREFILPGDSIPGAARYSSFRAFAASGVAPGLRYSKRGKTKRSDERRLR